MKIVKGKLESVNNELNIKYNDIKNQYDEYIKKSSNELQEKEKKYIELLNQKNLETDNYKKLTDQYEMEKSKILDKINELNKTLEQNDEIYKNIQKENLELKQQNQEKNNFLNSQIEIIKEKYKKQIGEEVAKIKEGLIKKIDDSLTISQEKYNDLYLNREKLYDKKFIKISNLISNNKNDDFINENYSYECTNSMYLSVYIYEGTEKAEFEIFLKNTGETKWAEDTKLLVDKNSSDVTTEDIPLSPQNPKEQKNYKIIVDDLSRYNQGEYKIIFSFYSGGKIHGEKITALIKIKENQKNEIDEYIDKINEFRETFNLSEDEYSNEKIIEVLKEHNMNFENAFSSLFN